MKLRFWDWIIFLVFGCLTFFHFRGFHTASEKVFPAAEFLSHFNPTSDVSYDGKPLLLFFLDFKDFSCMACLDSFLELYRLLPIDTKTSKAWGILAVEHSDGEGNRLFRIAEKKLKGFVRANHITFPILVDRFRVFEELVEDGSGVFLFDGTAKTVRRYDFPLSGEQFEEIFLNLTG